MRNSKAFWSVGLIIMNDTSESVFFLSSIYPRELIVRAKEDYQQICCISIEDNAGGIICTFSESITDINLTAKEFSNYLIELANTRSGF